MNKHYEHIRKVCIEKNPSILDLVMGCEIICSGIDDIKTIIKINDPFLWSGEVYYTWDFCWTRKDISKILGRPITLQDVLFAIPNKTIAIDALWIFYSILYDKSFVVPWSSPLRTYKYNLTLQLSEQSDEVLDWIAQQLWYDS